MALDPLIPAPTDLDILGEGDPNQLRIDPRGPLLSLSFSLTCTLAVAGHVALFFPLFPLFVFGFPFGNPNWLFSFNQKVLMMTKLSATTGKN